MEHPKDHRYTSTACLHGLHQTCRVNCKFCHAHCECACHLKAFVTCPHCYEKHDVTLTYPQHEVVSHSTERTTDAPKACADPFTYAPKMIFFLQFGNNIDFVRCSNCGEPTKMSVAEKAKRCPNCDAERDDSIKFFRGRKP